jgi:hypothetical protein
MTLPCDIDIDSGGLGNVDWEGREEAIVKLMELLSIIQNMEWMNATSGRKAARAMRISCVNKQRRNEGDEIS